MRHRQLPPRQPLYLIAVCAVFRLCLAPSDVHDMVVFEDSHGAYLYYALIRAACSCEQLCSDDF